MKAKSIFQCAALLTGLLLFNDPLFATVESDIVGYTTITLKPGYNMVNPCFNDLTSDEGILLDDFLPGTTTGLCASSDLTAATQILRWTGSTYETYYIYKAPRGGSELNYHWVDLDGNMNTCQLKAGDAVWIVQPKTASELEVTLAGTVPNDISQTHTIVPGMNMIGSGFTAAWDLNNCGIDWETVGQASSDLTVADSVQLWKDGTYTTYYLYKAPRGTSPLNYKWVKLDSTLADPIPVGAGVWFKSNTATTRVITEVRPYTL